MIGAEGASNLVAEMLADRVPGRLAAIAARTGAAEGTLPPLQLVTASDPGPLGLEQYPALIVMTRSSVPSGQVVEVDDPGRELYRSVYDLRCLLWVRGETYPDTDLSCKRTLLAVRETLLANRDVGQGTTVLPGSLREDYSGVFPDPAAGGNLAGAYVDLQVAVEEWLDPTTAAVGVVDRVEVRPAAHHPAPGPVHPAYL